MSARRELGRKEDLSLRPKVRMQEAAERMRVERTDLANKLLTLRDGSVSKQVDARISEFRMNQTMQNDMWFSELCFCILTAYSSAALGLRIQDCLGYKGFSELSLDELAGKLSVLGHRFSRARAEFIVEARSIVDLKRTITAFPKSRNAREWLRSNVRGLGLKESSHFLRNVGYFDLAILDRHIQKIMVEHQLVDSLPKSLTDRTYYAMEQTLLDFAREVELPVGELDLYLWYMKTGKVLK